MTTLAFFAILACSFAASQGVKSLFFKVNGVNKLNYSTIRVTSIKGNFYLDCYYDITLHPSLCEIDSSGKVLKEHFEVRGPPTTPYIRYIIPDSEKTYKHKYRCADDSQHIQVTLDYGSSQFQGLNPLVYTISAVILLGTLAIVAIITCWIRARRSFGVSTARGNNTAQDYLNYINDEEFTPLTQSEFLASLEERPPSYLESERIEQVNSDDRNVDEQSSPATRSRLVLPARLPNTDAHHGTRTHQATTADQENNAPVTVSHRSTH